jgi:hypothetical protein
MAGKKTPIFELVALSGVLPGNSCQNKKISDLELVQILVDIIKQQDENQLALAGTIAKLEKKLFDGTGEIYDDT